MLALPPYVYADKGESSLSQGDVLKVDGSFRAKFKEFYPGINHPDNEDKYVLVLTQSCDLVRIGKRKPKLPHINVCLVRSIEKVIEKIITDELQPFCIRDIKLLPKVEMDQLKNRLSKLLNNNDQKMHFFFPKKPPFEQDMIALLHMSFSFRTIEHYDTLLENRVLSLKPEFQAKLGHIISELYGRIATPDLSDTDVEWKDKERLYIDNLLIHANLSQVPEKSFIEFIKANASEEQADVKKLIEEHQGQILKKKFEPLKNDLLQGIRSRLMRIFDDPEKVNNLLKMEKSQRTKEIGKIMISSD